MKPNEKYPLTAELMHVAELRLKQLNMTHAQLAKAVGINKHTISACFYGHTEINVRDLLRIGTALNLNLRFVDTKEPTAAFKGPDNPSPE